MFMSRKIVCLCGSTRFATAFRDANIQETLRGHIVLTVGCDRHHGYWLGITNEDKKFLDDLHKDKIALADEVFILNVGGYLGASTLSELRYAHSLKKVIRFLEPVNSERLQTLIANSDG